MARSSTSDEALSRRGVVREVLGNLSNWSPTLPRTLAASPSSPGKGKGKAALLQLPPWSVAEVQGSAPAPSVPGQAPLSSETPRTVPAPDTAPFTKEGGLETPGQFDTTGGAFPSSSELSKAPALPALETPSSLVASPPRPSTDSRYSSSTLRWLRPPTSPHPRAQRVPGFQPPASPASQGPARRVVSPSRPRPDSDVPVPAAGMRAAPASRVTPVIHPEVRSRSSAHPAMRLRSAARDEGVFGTAPAPPPGASPAKSTRMTRPTHYVSHAPAMRVWDSPDKHDTRKRVRSALTAPQPTAPADAAPVATTAVPVDGACADRAPPTPPKPSVPSGEAPDHRAMRAAAPSTTGRRMSTRASALSSKLSSRRAHIAPAAKTVTCEPVAPEPHAATVAVPPPAPASTGGSAPLPAAERRPLPRTPRRAAAPPPPPMSAAELAQLTARHTRQNEVYSIDIETRVQRLPGVRPPSPSQSFLLGQGRRAREHFAPPAYGVDAHGAATQHARGAGEEEEYHTPPRQTGVRWDKRLVVSPTPTRPAAQPRSCLVQVRVPANQETVCV